MPTRWEQPAAPLTNSNKVATIDREYDTVDDLGKRVRHPRSLLKLSLTRHSYASNRQPVAHPWLGPQDTRFRRVFLDLLPEQRYIASKILRIDRYVGPARH